MNLLLTPSEKNSYIEARNRLISTLDEVIGENSTPWLRIVGKIHSDIWLIASTNRLETGNCDLDNLFVRSEAYLFYLVELGVGPWKYEFFGPGYWAFDLELADLVLMLGIKYWGVSFIYNLDGKQVDFVLLKILISEPKEVLD